MLWVSLLVLLLHSALVAAAKPSEPVRPTLLHTNLDDYARGVVGPFALPSVLATAQACIEEWPRIQDEWKDEGLLDKPYMKSPFAYVKACEQMALHPDLVAQVRDVMQRDGQVQDTEDIMLATMSPLKKAHGWQHRWHSDVESVVDPSCTDQVWTVWIPYSTGGAVVADNPTDEQATASSLHLITHTSNSTHLGQEILDEADMHQCKVCKEPTGKSHPTFEEHGQVLVDFARDKLKQSEATYVAVQALPGQAWMFRGTTFHGSVNRSGKTRQAFQFHFMPAKCRFRGHNMGQNTMPTMESLSPVMPVVVPLLGGKSAAVNRVKGAVTTDGHREPFPSNNWLFPDRPEPEKILIGSDKTENIMRRVNKREPKTKPHVDDIKEFAESVCNKKKDVDGAEGAIDKTKCKESIFQRRTELLRDMEYHASKLPKNSAAHSVRIHEELEFVYIISGKGVCTIPQSGPHSTVFYRREVQAGDLAYYPAWQGHGMVAVEDHELTYLPIRFLGQPTEEETDARYTKFWKDVRKHDIDLKYLTKTQKLPLYVETIDQNSLHKISDQALSTTDILLLLVKGKASWDGEEIDTPGTIFVPRGSYKRPNKSVNPLVLSTPDSRLVAIYLGANPEEVIHEEEVAQQDEKDDGADSRDGVSVDPLSDEPQSEPEAKKAAVPNVSVDNVPPVVNVEEMKKAVPPKIAPPTPRVRGTGQFVTRDSLTAPRKLHAGPSAKHSKRFHSFPKPWVRHLGTLLMLLLGVTSLFFLSGRFRLLGGFVSRWKSTQKTN